MISPVEEQQDRRRRFGAASGPTDGRSLLSRMLEEEDALQGCRDHQSLQLSEGRCAPNLVWREKVAQWCYDVVDHLHESRDIVFVAMNVLDRYCIARQLSDEGVNERDYEVAALTALFLAVRISGSGDLEAPDLIRMSRIGVRIQEIVQVGKSMTEALSWERRLLTPLNFVRVMLDFLPTTTETSLKRSLFESASYLVEVSVCDVFFSGKSSAQVAVAAIINVIGDDATSRLSNADRSAFYDQLVESTGIECDHPESIRLKSRLLHIYLQSEESRDAWAHVIPEVDEDEIDVIIPSRVTVRVVSSEKIAPTAKNRVETSQCPATQAVCNKRSVSPTVETTSRKTHRST